MMLPPAWFSAPVEIVAQALIGCTILCEGVGGVIVETEAYGRTDPASHSVRGPTPRNAAMFGPPGRLYIYRSYGLHWCANIVAGTEPGGAVLLRALQPTRGLAQMRERRGPVADGALVRGPGCLTQALGITGAENGCSVMEPPFALSLPPDPVALVSGPRIGISRAVETPWRYALAGSRFVSRSLPVPR